MESITGGAIRMCQPPNTTATAQCKSPLSSNAREDAYSENFRNTSLINA